MFTKKVIGTAVVSGIAIIGILLSQSDVAFGPAATLALVCANAVLGIIAVRFDLNEE